MNFGREVSQTQENVHEEEKTVDFSGKSLKLDTEDDGS